MAINRKLIRDKIISLGGIVEFSKKHKIRQASLSDFLNGKTGILFDSFEKILDLELCEKLPGKIIKVETIYVAGITYGKGMDFHGNKIVECLGCQGSSHQFFVFKNSKGEFYLKTV